jgi:hypothetical protein
MVFTSFSFIVHSLKIDFYAASMKTLHNYTDLLKGVPESMFRFTDFAVRTKWVSGSRLLTVN